MEEDISAIILAAGQGKRMRVSDVNKVTLPLKNKPMIVHTVDLLLKVGVRKIFVVVGFAKDSVIQALSRYDIEFVEQLEQKGTGDAVRVALEKLPKVITDVFVMQGDDSAFFKPLIIRSLVDTHRSSGAQMTFLTVEMENPAGLGRVVRDDLGNVIVVVEEKDATDTQRLITEVNPACYIFKTAFLKKYLPQIKKSDVTGEYYLTSLIDLAISHKELIETVVAGPIQWRGVNTLDELHEAENLL